MENREEQKIERAPWKPLLWIAIAGLIFGVLGLGEIGDDVLRTGRNALHWHKASGDIVVVEIDNDSLRKVGRWPWPRRYHAQLLDALTEAGAKRVFFDIQLYGPSSEPWFIAPGPDARMAPTMITELMALVTLISGVCSAGVTVQTTW